jgi:hypothetical protein
VTFKDLKKRVSLETYGQNIFFERLRDKLFWFWNIEELKQRPLGPKETVVFNHIIGLPLEKENNLKDDNIVCSA